MPFVGNYTIARSGYSSNNYTISNHNGTLSITQAPLTITANNETRLVGNANPTLSATYTGFKLGQTPSVLGGTLQLNTLANTTSPVGNYAIIPSGVTASNYAIQFVNGQLIVAPKPVTSTNTPPPFLLNPIQAPIESISAPWISLRVNPMFQGVDEQALSPKPTVNGFQEDADPERNSVQLNSVAEPIRGRFQWKKKKADSQSSV